ncbi:MULTISPECIES: hypothetical protein [unclassified Rhizobium]|jgi:hypothetical protein|uniref:hypothetical protein n=1 Tax=unclassified Rhizobium TaxID=2613769 RepID=UPI0006480C79|nr:MULTISPECIES: hypothetical protein [unclassified Rhizobium]MBN8949414.1 hypothetical protein [Rhizobium tropici]OJY75210.1 MAG: hypothetical protein BGP09_36040 [Rhizobium sp. 60-20]RKD70802.1 hypothetical protein BJ928_103323 [Rhizobium sp. WW_1]
MREVQLSTNHCPRIGLSLLVALGVMLAGSVPGWAANAAGENALRRTAGEDIRKSVIVNWLRPADQTDLKEVHVQIRFALDRAGEIVGKPKVTMTGGPQKTQRAVAASAMRAVLRAAPFKNLPMDQYDVWKEVIINFEAGDLGH